MSGQVVGRCLLTLALMLVTFLGAVAVLPRFFPVLGDLRTAPAPYTVPIRPDAMPLHLAMVHDLLHDRYPRHGEAWYRYRIDRLEPVVERLMGRREEEIAVADLDAWDDLAMAYEQVGRIDEGLELLARKEGILRSLDPEMAATPPSANALLDRMLRELQEQGSLPLGRGWDEPDPQPTGLHRAWYRLYANRGTLRAHAAMAGLAGGVDPSHTARHLTSARDDILRALAIDPHAHFDRELWQALAIGHLRACCADQESLQRVTMCGQLLPSGPVATERSWTARAVGDGPRCQGIRQVRLDASWLQRVKATLAEAEIGFDQPLLGLLGMWYAGGGPNPHSALAIGVLMEEVGQRELAWYAYERATGMVERFWPDPVQQAWLRDWCEERQRLLAAALGIQAETLREHHRRERVVGQAWQSARQTYAGDQLAAGRDQDDPGFFTEFLQQHGAIATPIGGVDQVHFRREDQPLVGGLAMAVALCLAGLTGLLAARLPMGAREAAWLRVERGRRSIGDD